MRSAHRILAGLGGETGTSPSSSGGVGSTKGRSVAWGPRTPRYRSPLLVHAQEHLARGTLISTEADAFWLPDTAGTDYRRQHTKSTIVLHELDLAAGRLGYFHNAGYYTLDGEDFIQTFRVGFPPDPAFMPLFAETVRVDRAVQRSQETLAELARISLRRHLARRPAGNPVTRFSHRLEADLPLLQVEGLDVYHAWAFATLRQLGGAFEALALHLRWLESASRESLALAAAAAAFHTISVGAKALILKGARAVNAKRPLNAGPALQELADAWQRGIDRLTEEVDG